MGVTLYVCVCVCVCGKIQKVDKGCTHLKKEGHVSFFYRRSGWFCVYILIDRPVDKPDITQEDRYSTSG
jgi:hypothetical protein